ncbi:MAG: ATP-binding protein [Gammaproteobacteria bacterium]
MDEGRDSFLRDLCALRWLAIAGQSISIAAGLWWLGLALEPAPLYGGVAVLVLFNAWATWRTAGADTAGAPEAFAHICMDIAVLAWLIAWSGGAMNPFVSLFLVPIALAAPALPLRWVWATAGASAVGYLAAVGAGHRVPIDAAHHHSEVALHLWGMGVNFVISAAIFLYFLSRMARALRTRERQLAGLREQNARDEAIIALATHAAAVAHELNTPLGTMTLTLTDIAEDYAADPRLGADVALLQRLVANCRDKLKRLAMQADPAAQEPQPLPAYVDDIVERWKLIRPVVDLRREPIALPGVMVKPDPAVSHLLQALLNNAADASASLGTERIDLRLAVTDGALRGEIRDFGPGMSDDAHPRPWARFRSTKPDGMGVGLALSHATVERLGGSLSLEAAGDGGAITRFELPLARLQAA